ncbi:MAG: ABC transporter ATP-binding protein, partial [Candidatus Acidiferrales bacterium]
SRRRVGSIIGDPLAIHNIAKGDERRKRVQGLMEVVGLNPEHYNRFPAEFSGGQRQRIGVARALALHPKLIVADEPVSALDVSVGAQILELLARLRQELSLTMILISHSLPVVAQLASRVAVMQSGKFVETGAAEQVLQSPQHPYTQALVAAVPDIPE